MPAPIRDSAKRIRTSSSMHRACSHFPNRLLFRVQQSAVHTCLSLPFDSNNSKRDNATTMRNVHFAKEKRERSQLIGIGNRRTPNEPDDDHRDHQEKYHERKKERKKASKNVSKTYTQRSTATKTWINFVNAKNVNTSFGLMRRHSIQTVIRRRRKQQPEIQKVLCSRVIYVLFFK